MSYVVTPFEVTSKALGAPAQVRFVHLLSGIATRHSDTIDCVFLVNGKRVMVALPCATLTRLRDKDRKSLTDQQLVDLSARHLCRTLEQGYDPTLAELTLSEEEFLGLARELRYL